MEICSLGMGAAQFFVVSLDWTRPKRNDRQANHAPAPAGDFPEGLLPDSANVKNDKEKPDGTKHEGRNQG